MPLAPEIIESVSNTNLKNVGDSPAFYTGLAMGNTVNYQQAMQQIQLAAVGSIIKKLTEIDTEEAVSVLKATSGNEVAATIAQLAAALSSNQQGSKIAGNTPPVTP